MVRAPYLAALLMLRVAREKLEAFRGGESPRPSASFAAFTASSRLYLPHNSAS